MASGVHDEMGHAATSDEQARDWAKWLERARARRDETTVPNARRSVARALGVAPGTIERLRNGRVKGIRQWLFDRIRALVIREIEREIQRLTHELEIAQQSGADPRGVDMVEIETHLAKVRELLR